MNGHDYFMDIALAEARLALNAGEFPVGCILVRQGEIVASGRRERSRSSDGLAPTLPNELDHAEIVALRRLTSRLPEAERHELTVYSTLEPCLMCFGALLINRVSTIVYAYEDAMGGGTNLELARLNPFYRQMEIKVISQIRRRESLELFQQFFANPGNSYLRGTMLETYTLAQGREEGMAECRRKN